MSNHPHPFEVGSPIESKHFGIPNQDTCLFLSIRNSKHKDLVYARRPSATHPVAAE